MRCILPCLIVIVSAVAPRPASAQYYWFSEIVHTGDLVPGGAGMFIAVGPPCNSAGLVTFYGKGSAGEAGLFAGDGSSLPAVVVDNTFTIPGGQGTFTDFGSASRNGNIVAFQALGGGGQTGVYIHYPVPPCNLVADTNSPIPGGQGNFTGFGGVGTDGTNVAFHGFGSAGQEGIYVHLPNPPCNLVADRSTLIPGGQLGKFTGFYPVPPCNDQGNVAFGGTGSQGYAGYFLYDGNQITTLIDTFHPVPPFYQSTFSQIADAVLSGNALAFHGYGTGGEEGVYVAGIVTPFAIVAQKGDQFDGGPVLTGFGAVAYDGTHVAFIGYGSKEIYADFGGTMRRVISVGDALVGRTVADLDMAPDALGIDQVAFRATFTDGSEGIYNGTFVPTGSGVGGTPAVSALTLDNHPNPFERTTEIEVSLPAAGSVHFEVYDVAGRRVHARDLGYRTAGRVVVSFDGGTLASGVYFCRVDAAGYHATHKLLIQH